MPHGGERLHVMVASRFEVLASGKAPMLDGGAAFAEAFKIDPSQF